MGVSLQVQWCSFVDLCFLVLLGIIEDGCMDKCMGTSRPIRASECWVMPSE